MIRLFTGTARTRFAAVVMAACIPVFAFAQTAEPAAESTPAVTKPAAAASASDRNNADREPPGPGSSNNKPALPANIEVEIQKRFNELRSKLLDERAEYLDAWLSVVAIVLTFFGIVAVIAGAVAGSVGFKRFKRIEVDAKASAKAAKEHLGEIKRVRDASHAILADLNAQNIADNPEKADQAVAEIQKNPAASLLDKAVARAVSLYREGKRDNAVEQWRAVALIAQEDNKDLAVAAWFSVGYLVQGENPEEGIVAYDKAIALKPDYADAYINRGNVKGDLGRHKAAIADYDEAIRLKLDYTDAYYNRGIAQFKLGRPEEAIADYNKAIRLKPDYADAYNNRGIAKAKLGRYKEAITDCDEAIRLKPDYASAHYNRGLTELVLGRKDKARSDFEAALKHAQAANDSNLVDKVRQSLRKLDDTKEP